VPKPSEKYQKCAHLLALGSAIRATRRQIKMSQEALALAADLDRSYVGAIERGEINVAFTNLLKIAAALDTPVSVLVMGITVSTDIVS
jgi:transcriptional regulator with XRE-family HTH domain